MKLAELSEMYDTRKEFRREAGDLNYHRAIESQPKPSSNEVWLWSNGKRVYGPFKDVEAAERFKKNRPDRIPANAVAK